MKQNVKGKSVNQIDTLIKKDYLYADKKDHLFKVSYNDLKGLRNPDKDTQQAVKDCYHGDYQRCLLSLFVDNFNKSFYLSDRYDLTQDQISGLCKKYFKEWGNYYVPWRDGKNDFPKRSSFGNAFSNFNLGGKK